MDKYLLGTIIVSNEEMRDIFRIHVFDEYLKFDAFFAYGISQNNEMFNDIEKINYGWQNKDVKKDEIFQKVGDVIEKHYDYISEFYFRDDEVNTFGKLKQTKAFSSQEDKKYLFYMTLKHYLSGLKQISRNEFEQNINNENIAEAYIEKFKKNNCKYYFYTTDDFKNKVKPCFIMLNNRKFNFGFFGKE